MILLDQGSTKLIQGNIHTTKTMTEYNTELESTLTKCSLLVVSYCDPSALVMSWYDPSIAALVMSLCVVSPVILSSSTLPPFTGRGPASVKCDAPSSCQFQILDSVTPTWVRTANMPETPLSITWQLRLTSVCVSPLIYSFWSRVLLHGCSVVFSLSSLARTLPGRRVCRENRSQSSSSLVSPQVKETAPGHVPGHKHTPHNGFQQKLYIIQN